MKVVLVAGAHGVSGRAAAQHFSTIPGVSVHGLSRRSAPLPPGVIAISVDLLNIANVRQQMGAVKDITHIVFGAYIERHSAAEKSAVNVAMLKNLLDFVEEASHTLEHVTFYQGGKAYGADLGPFKTPAREDDPRLMPQTSTMTRKTS